MILLKNCMRRSLLACWCSSDPVSFLSVYPFMMVSFLPCSSSGAEFRGLALRQEPHQPFQVLRRGRQEELLGDIPETLQSHAAQTEALLELREQSFDLAPEALGAGIS